MNRNCPDLYFDRNFRHDPDPNPIYISSTWPHQDLRNKCAERAHKQRHKPVTDPLGFGYDKDQDES